MICPNCHGSGVVEKYEEKRRDEHVVMVTLTEVKCDKCNGTGQVAMTNADRIRSMSDEELAITRIRYDGELDAYVGDFDYCEMWFEDAIKAEIEWLQQPWEGEKC